MKYSGMLCATALALSCLLTAYGQVNSQIGLPVLFVHGICDSADNYLDGETAVQKALSAKYPTLYSSSGKYVAFFNGSQVYFQKPGAKVIGGVQNPPVLTVDPRTRFFLVALDQPGVANYQDFDRQRVAQIPIYEKGYELANVIWKIRSITGAPRVIVVAHSMGGLDARAYLEHVASASGSANTAVPYYNDVAALVTLDTPHGGAQIAGISLPDPFPWLECIANDSLDKSELEPSSSVIRQLDYLVSGASPLPQGTTITSIASYWADGVFGLIAIPGSDDLMKKNTQDLSAALSLPAAHSKSTLILRENEFHSTFTTPSSAPLVCGDDDLLHLQSCTGNAPQTLAYIDTAVISSAVAYPNHVMIQPAVWSIHTGKQVAFTAAEPVLWSIREGASGGQISAAGIYTAPLKILGSSQTFHVVAIRASYLSEYGEAEITVTH